MLTLLVMVELDSIRPNHLHLGIGGCDLFSGDHLVNRPGGRTAVGNGVNHQTEIGVVPAGVDAFDLGLEPIVDCDPALSFDERLEDPKTLEPGSRRRSGT